MSIDAYPFSIDTTDPETLARWLVEKFAYLEKWSTPATFVQIQVYPTISPDGSRADWITNMALNGPISGAIHTPREFVAQLAERLDDLDYVDRHPK